MFHKNSAWQPVGRVTYVSLNLSFVEKGSFFYLLYLKEKINNISNNFLSVFSFSFLFFLFASYVQYQQICNKQLYFIAVVVLTYLLLHIFINSAIFLVVGSFLLSWKWPLADVLYCPRQEIFLRLFLISWRKYCSSGKAGWNYAYSQQRICLGY